MNIYKVDVSVLSSLYNKTMLYYLIQAFDSFNLEKEDVIHFINNEIGNYEYIFEQLEQRIDNLQRVTNLIDNAIDYSTFNGDNYYNAAVNVIMMDKVHKLLKKIDFKTDTESIVKNVRILNQIKEIIIHLNLGVNDYAIRRAQASGDFNFKSKYMPSPLLIGYLEDCIQMWNLFAQNYIDIESEEVRRMLILKFGVDIDFIKNKVNFIEFMLSIICMLESPFYKEDCKRTLFEMYKAVQELMHNSNIGSFFIEYGNISNIPQQKRTSKDRTTRIQILFILDNNRPYSLRIDLPHEGEPYVHLNIEGIDSGNAVPISIGAFKYLKNQVSRGSELGKIFSKYDDKYWFCPKFEKNILDLNLLDEEKNMLEQLFKQQSHFKIANVDDGQEIKVITCFDELKTYINRNVHNSHYALNSQKLNRNELLKKLQLIIQLSTICSLCVLPTWLRDEKDRKNQLEDIKEKFVDLLYDYYQYCDYPQNELRCLDLLTILELIAEELY